MIGEVRVLQFVKRTLSDGCHLRGRARRRIAIDVLVRTERSRWHEQQCDCVGRSDLKAVRRCPALASVGHDVQARLEPGLAGVRGIPER